jgi:pimeloyl-ACP methyl ester carboxylesterase
MPLAEIPLRAWRKRAREFVFRGHAIRYWVAGQGEPLLLIHGFPTASWDWHYLWQPLAQRNLVIACDMLGFGDSAKPLDHAYCLLEQADLQQALLAHLRVEQPVHVLAHDYGDSVAQELLARHYEGRFEMASCVFLNGGLFPKPIARRWCKNCCSAPGLDDRSRVRPQCLGRQLQQIFGPDTRPSESALDDFWSLIEQRRPAHPAQTDRLHSPASAPA